MKHLDNVQFTLAVESGNVTMHADAPAIRVKRWDGSEEPFKLSFIWLASEWRALLDRAVYIDGWWKPKQSRRGEHWSVTLNVGRGDDVRQRYNEASASLAEDFISRDRWQRQRAERQQRRYDAALRSALIELAAKRRLKAQGAQGAQLRPPLLFTDCSTTVDHGAPGLTRFTRVEQTYETGRQEAIVVAVRLPEQAWLAINARLHIAALSAMETKLREDEARGWSSSYRPNVSIEVTSADVERWTKLYGQGVGRVKVDAAPDVMERLETDIVKDERREVGPAPDDPFPPVCLVRPDDRPSLQRHFESWKTIARNATWSARQTAELRVSKDGGGYFLSVVRPDGKRDMVGGLFNHCAPGEAPRWSSHS